ncbi:MAG TPA: serine/threonine-protein kinase [Pirellulales bacterium]|nr:serine/threonine-protein kinase [Pirellulales bacterium]
MNDSCPSDEELLAAATGEEGTSQVRLHAEQCAACGERFEALRGEIGALRSFSRSLDASQQTQLLGQPTADDPPALDRIGRYHVVGILESGGQADVYRVLDPDLARPLVLKLWRLSPHNDQAHREAAINEGRLLATLDHAGLPRVFDVGVLEDRPYLVLEYVPGRNLEQCFDRQRPAPDEAARIIAEAAGVLAYAHRRGVVHGDVTPRNIMIDAEGRTRIIDLGLARFDDIWEADGGRIGGTPEFLPPELAAGPRRPAGPAGDVFGLGATLYWLLTSRGPFAAASVSDSLRRAREGDVDFSPLQLPGMPGRLSRLCRRALAIEPAQRPTADELARQLERLAKRRPKMRRDVMTVVILLAALVAIETVGWFLGRRAKPAAESKVDDGRAVLLSVPAMTVVRRNEPVNLSNVLPLRTGDPISISCSVQPDEPLVLLWFDAQGELRILSADRRKVDEVDGLFYPGWNRFEPAAGSEGTDLIFACRGVAPAESEIRGCFPLGQPAPPIPENLLLRLSRRTFDRDGPLEPQSEAARQVDRAEQFIRQIDDRLRRHFAGVRCLAVPHRAALEAAEAD